MTIIIRSMSAALGLGLVVSACTSDGTPTVYMALSYQVRCQNCQPRAPDDAAHQIKNVNTELGLKLECTVRDIQSVRRVNFSATHNSTDSNDNFAITLENGRLGDDESDGPCDLRVVEGNNTYEGACGTDDPSSDHPCQAHFREENGIIRGDLQCQNIPNMSNLTSQRYVYEPGTTDALKFEIYGCGGLGLE
jgi:hypothetical protein